MTAPLNLILERLFGCDQQTMELYFAGTLPMPPEVFRRVAEISALLAAAPKSAPMSAAEFKEATELLTTRLIAHVTGRPAATLRNYSNARTPVPADVAEAVRRLRGFVETLRPEARANSAKSLANLND